MRLENRTPRGFLTERKQEDRILSETAMQNFFIKHAINNKIQLALNASIFEMIIKYEIEYQMLIFLNTFCLDFTTVHNLNIIAVLIYNSIHLLIISTLRHFWYRYILFLKTGLYIKYVLTTFTAQLSFLLAYNTPTYRDKNWPLFYLFLYNM